MKRLRLAAAQEEVRALYRLGNALFHGSPELGITPSPEKAKEFFSAAASKGCARSQYELGFLAGGLDGIFGPEALRWCTLSAAQGKASPMHSSSRWP